MKLNSEACIYTLSLCIVFSYDLIASKLLCIYYRRREIISIILYYVYIIGTEIIVVLYCIMYVLQAQRDYFGAHTYELLSNPGEFVHTNWTGRGGNVSSTTYDA